MANALNGQIEQACFVFDADFGVYGFPERRQVQFFRNHYIIHYVRPNHSISRPHTLTREVLNTIKHFQFGRMFYDKSWDMFEYYEKNKSEFVVDSSIIEKEKDKLVRELAEQKCAFETEREKFESYRKIFELDREKLETDRQKLKSELAKSKSELAKSKSELTKYKSIISNCQREIKAYGL